MYIKSVDVGSQNRSFFWMQFLTWSNNAHFFRIKYESMAYIETNGRVDNRSRVPVRVSNTEANPRIIKVPDDDDKHNDNDH